MNPQERLGLLKRRFGVVAPMKAEPCSRQKPRGLVRAKLPTQPNKRAGVTWVVKRRRMLSSDSLGPAFYATPLKWLETMGVPNNAFKRLELSRKRRVSPLIRIAEQFPKKAPREKIEA